MGELHIRPSAVLTTLIFGNLSVSVQGVGCLILLAITLIGWGDEFNLLRILSLSFGLLALVIREIRFP